MLGLLWYLQRRLTRGGGAGAKAVRRRRNEGIAVLARQGLGGRAQLIVVEVDGTRYVLGVTEQGVSVVDRTRAPQQIGAPAASAPDFDALLADAGLRLDREEAEETAPADPPLRRTRTRRPDPLAGSILSPGTWRQAASAVRRPR